jgi:hypothetical protein
MQVSDLLKYDAWVRENFVYLADPENLDSWRSHLHEVTEQHDKEWNGDCDDLASTTLDALSRVWDTALLWRALVRAEGSPGNVFVDHMIGLARMPGGPLYIVGDTFGSPCLTTQRGHKIQMVSQVSAGVSWKQGLP